MSDLGPGLAEELLAGEAEDPAQAVVDLEPDLVHGGDRHADQAEIEHAAEALFAAAQSMLDVLLAGDVAADPAQRDDAPVFGDRVKGVLVVVQAVRLRRNMLELHAGLFRARVRIFASYRSATSGG